MPGGDRRGPLGEGPMTGRGMGFCSGYQREGYAQRPFYGKGSVRGRGRGFGFGMHPIRAGYFAPEAGQSTESEIAFLKSEISAFENTIQQLSARLNELQDSSGE